MPQLRQAQADIKQFMLPSTSALPEAEQAWVKMDVGEMLAGDFMDVVNDNDITVGSISGEMLASRIKEWNFTEADGTPTPISLATVRRLEPEDLTYLFGQFDVSKLGATLNEAQKKT